MTTMSSENPRGVEISSVNDIKSDNVDCCEETSLSYYSSCAFTSNQDENRTGIVLEIAIASECRICLETLEQSPLLELGCMCPNELRWAHERCIMKWFGPRLVLHDVHDCEVCKAILGDHVLSYLQGAYKNDEEFRGMLNSIQANTQVTVNVDRPVRPANVFERNMQIIEGIGFFLILADICVVIVLIILDNLHTT